MDHRHWRGRRNEWRDVGDRRAVTAGPGGKSASLPVPVRLGHRRAHLLHGFPLMVLFIIFCPIVAAILIMIGAPARRTALTACVLTFAAALYLLATFGDGEHGFQHVTSFTISPEWRLRYRK